MSKLEELIEKLCPDGVEYKKLGEVCDFKYGIGNTIPKEQGKYPVYGSNGVVGTHNKYNAEDITVIGHIGSAGAINWASGKVFVTYNGIMCLPKMNILNSKYLHHFLTSFNFTPKGSQPFISYGDIAKKIIPLPPLPVQEEIVRILDNFTRLTAELTAELTARKMQYEYYRDKLLTFGEDVPMVKLGDTCHMKSGKPIATSNISLEKTDTTSFECFGGNGVRGFISEPSHHGEYPIIGRQGALCGNVNYAVGDFYATEHAVVVKTNGRYNQRFLYYLLTAMNLNQYKSQGAQPGLAVGNIENLIAPVPELEEQQRIVTILDRFDTLCNDISSGLPAEIEARKKQYEYYRDKLLTFKELS